MSNILKFIRPNTTFDPNFLTVLGDVYDWACAQYCSCETSKDCDVMAEKIFAAASRGERDPDKLWQIGVQGLRPPPDKSTPA